jgi:ketosteroid isomerase-like protein
MKYPIETLKTIHFPEDFQQNFNTGKLENILTNYEADSILDLGEGQSFSGLEKISQALSNFLATKLPIHVSNSKATENGGLALVTFDWSIDGLGPDGTNVSMAGRAIDVLRRNSNGYWKQIIDQPFGRI